VVALLESLDDQRRDNQLPLPISMAASMLPDSRVNHLLHEFGRTTAHTDNRTLNRL
jgi:hypothetical protein